ncbi:MAG TPA: 5-dehydro-4-deoxy-D-glucuronate isomerase [Flavisolibacter sp.]|jgi:4-deoxy-L-threo-5-hexosulose-uronate ketol-isomerase|nr:5-dehydro-4-deoxy-D-glucuronate isomerase [Flavisolibacter sp.]
MRVIHQVHPEDFVSYNTQKIREKFLLDKLVVPDKIEVAYTHYDRMIIGSAFPVTSELKLETYDELKAEYFLSRRELGIASIGGNGTVTVDGDVFSLEKLDCLYIGKGKQDIRFKSNDAGNPAKFILFSAPAHAEYPNRLMKPAEALPAELGSLDNNNHRTINKYIHNDGIKSCQLVMGITVFKTGSIWNTMPPHTHDRRMEAYFYFDLPENQRVIHFMGEPHETRHLFLNNDEGIVSPAWSIHSGTATANYSFIWAMAGENMVFTDMDPVAIGSLQ